MKTIAVNRNETTVMNPKVFMLWSFLGTIIMMFAGLTSAYIVRKGAGEWVLYKLPDLFWLSTGVILISSILLYVSQKALFENKLTLHKITLGATLLSGIAFVILQYYGWQQLTSYGVRLTGNPSGSFLYIISGLHALHILGGIVFLVIFFAKSLLKRDVVDKLLEELNPNRFLGYKLLSTYWHFVGLLWLYLFVFFWYNSF